METELVQGSRFKVQGLRFKVQKEDASCGLCHPEQREGSVNVSKEECTSGRNQIFRFAQQLVFLP